MVVSSVHCIVKLQQETFTHTHTHKEITGNGGLVHLLVGLFSVRFVVALLVLVSFVGGSGEIGAQVSVSNRERFIGIVGCSAPSQIIVL